MCEERVTKAIEKSAYNYPALAEALRRLEIVHCGMDMSVFIDIAEEALFTVVRGTNPSVFRDLGNDVLVALGCVPWRTSSVVCEYQTVRKRYPSYRSFGAGYSLGGTVIHEVACMFDHDPEFSFTRVDVFNAGGSPLRRQSSSLHNTNFHSHRIDGDPLSRYYQPPGIGASVEHVGRRTRKAHSLTNFVPNGLTRLTLLCEPRASAVQTQAKASNSEIEVCVFVDKTP